MLSRVRRAFPIDNRLADICKQHGLPDDTVAQVVESGFYLRDWVNPFFGKTWQSVSDMMYGNKGQSSNIPIDAFVAHLRGDKRLAPLPPFAEARVRTRQDIIDVLSTTARQHYVAEGSLSFRGQAAEFTYKRSIPNPLRADAGGREVSVMPGLYRQQGPLYSFADLPTEVRSWEWFLRDLEPNNQDVYVDSSFAYDIMRTEQHYAAATRGLDISFDLESALFFACHRFVKAPSGLATYEPVERGRHTGVIYCFRFTQPSVMRTEYRIGEFDLFRTYRPERVLRQACGLPLIGNEERNIATADIDCIIRLDRDFEADLRLTPEYMFPGISEDPFYARLLELKDRFPDKLANVVEYEWARV